MSQSLSKVYVHISFSTKNRMALIDNDIKSTLFEYLGGICKGLECNQYIENQEEHHNKKTFQDEFRAFLNKYKIEFNERYIWD